MIDVEIFVMESVEEMRPRKHFEALTKGRDVAR
jgi:hypothetical protein